MKRVFGSPAVVAWAAVVISLAQLLFSVPLLTKFYMGSELKVSKMNWSIAGPSAGRFTLSNSGRGAANNVEVGLLLHPNGYVQLLPDIGHKFECREGKSYIRNCRISIKRLPPGEMLRVVIFRGGKPDAETEKMLKLLTATGMTVPRLEYVHSDDGVAKSSFDIQNRTEVIGEVERQ